MGKGNEFIRTRDRDGVRTYYFDYADFDSIKKTIEDEAKEWLNEQLADCADFAARRRKVTQFYRDGRLPIDIDDESVYDRITMYAEDESDNLSYEIAGETDGLPGFARIGYYAAARDPEIVGGSYSSGMVIAESEHCQFVIADNECNIAMGCIPKKSRDELFDKIHYDEYDQVVEEAEAELEKTRKCADASYVITNDEILKTADEKIKARVDEEWEKYLDVYRKEANAVMAKVHEYFGTQSICERSGAWTSCRLPKFDDIPENERETYYY